MLSRMLKQYFELKREISTATRKRKEMKPWSTEKQATTKNTNQPQTTKWFQSTLTFQLYSINVLNSLIKRHELAEWIEKQNLSIFCLQESHLSFKSSHYHKGWEKVFQENWIKNQVGIVIPTVNKIYFKLKLIRRGKEHFILIKGSINKGNIAALNRYYQNWCT